MCKKCGKALSGQQTVYCSQRCGKLHLKSLYKKRNRDKVNEYNRQRALKVKLAGGALLNDPKTMRRRLGNFCARCGKDTDLHVHHIIPTTLGGTNNIENLLLFCRKCHSLWHQRLGDFWY